MGWIYGLLTLKILYRNHLIHCERSEAEAPESPLLRKGPPSTVTREKELRFGSFNIDFSKNHL